MEKYIDPHFLLSWISSLWNKSYQLVTNTDTLLEVAVIIIGLLLARLLARPLIKRLQQFLDSKDWRNCLPGRLIRAFLPLISFIFAIFLLRIGSEIIAKYKLSVLLIDTTVGIPRVMAHPKPVCQLKNFGDSAIDMELRIWISDPENGIANISSAVRIAIWDTFKEQGIEIPFPQRDVHIKSQSNRYTACRESSIRWC
jgi:hypothetical protein